ncbi:NADP-dependent oxidoreductase [Isoptericola halotolerans]|uniref:NADP-dependent oxidoreductase n=1 Tax=Isoptericola halotolerans TaxID=300560 RepID=UPI00389085E8
MKAIRYHEYGTTEVLRQEEVDRPSPGPGQVLVKVTSTSFNPVDDHIRLGVLAEAIPALLPITPGLDLAATAPTSVPLADAAALPLTGLAARQAVIELAEVRPGQTVLVNGAGGAVGSIVVQLAADVGAHVTAVDAPRHAGRLRRYGAENVVGPLDLDAGPAAVDGPFDVVINHVRLAPEGLAALTAYVADGGIAVSSAGPVPADEERSVRTACVWVASDGSHLADLVARVDGNRLAVHVVDRRPLAHLPAVHAESAAGTLVGKTVITVP